MRGTGTEALRIFDMIPGGSYAAGTTTATGVDVSAFTELLVVLSSKLNQATGTLDVKCRHCDTVGGTYADISGAVFTQLTTANDTAVYTGRINLDPVKAFVNVVGVVATAACEYGVIFIAIGAIAQPVTQAQTVVFSV